MSKVQLQALNTLAPRQPKPQVCLPSEILPGALKSKAYRVEPPDCAPEEGLLGLGAACGRPLTGAVEEVRDSQVLSPSTL